MYRKKIEINKNRRVHTQGSSKAIKSGQKDSNWNQGDTNKHGKVTNLPQNRMCDLVNLTLTLTSEHLLLDVEFSSK